ncbi:integrase [Paraburkholderia phytofirmans OLGA172]|uniref:Integrase n=1 Tax=Paraburkholderia phytofirmans OLGA172 TaxID=1417228 RepID=A0A160FTY2_9BURK|nr:site-specific integrase [Paraburkholderia phytofirmans]ANB76316.1 integrase [Paraburkholderia phytofirmans OLGA172]
MTNHAVVLRPSQIRHLLRVTEATSRHPERDVLILLLGITCGMHVTEIARVEIADVMTQSGAIRDEVSLRAVITKSCRQRCVYLTHEKTRAALERYLTFRVRRQLGTSLDECAYRGLIASNRLILTHNGTAYELSLKRRTNGEGGQVGYWAADSLQSYVTSLYRAAGLQRGYSSHFGRRTFANRLLAQCESFETVQTLLGHAELDHVISYLDDDPARIRAALESFSADFMPDHDDA